jgi:hypothetical protein
MYVLVDDDRGGLVLRRLQPWHRLLARCQAGRLDRALAEGTSPEESASLAARAERLTSTEFRRDLAASLQRILMATGESPRVRPARPAVASKSPDAAHPPRIPLSRARIGQSARPLAGLASRLSEPGPVPARGVAMVTRLLSDGTGPLYREACRDDLGVIIERARNALTW